MKTKTIYEADDGTRFDSETECRLHECVIISCHDAMLPLGPERKIKGEQYVQHTREACLQAKRNMLAIVRKQFAWLFKDAWATVSDDEIRVRSAIGRVIDDGDCRPIQSAWERLSRINWDNFREYEQQYFANHPDSVTE